MANISLIIPNFNGQHLMAVFLPSLLSAIKECHQSRFEIILVDNGSTDNSVLEFNKFPNSLKVNDCSLKIIQNSTNLGFAAAVNQGIKAASQPYVCLINNDITLTKKWFQTMFKSIKQNPDVACFCGTILNHSGTAIESQGISFEWSGKCIQNTSNLPNYLSKFVWGSSAAIVIYRKNILKKIGLFDEKYFAYLEDVDVAFRLQQHHYQTLLVPLAIAYHQGGATADKIKNFRAGQVFKNWFYFISKNYSLVQIIKYFPQIVIERLRNLAYLIKSSQ